MRKHFHLTIEEDRLHLRARRWQCTRSRTRRYLRDPHQRREPRGSPRDEAVQAYKRLAQVERAFRSFKSVDLKVRPIHHRLEERVRAHVLLCMLAYYVEWHMRHALAPLLFDDDDPAAAAAARSSVVAPAQRSQAAQRKAITQLTADDTPVHSFQSLLAELATFTRNTMAMAAAPHDTFLLYPQPTPIQLRAFELLAVQPRL